MGTSKVEGIGMSVHTDWTFSRAFTKALATMSLLIAAGLASASEAGKDASSDASGSAQIILVVGAAGTDEYGDQFAEWAGQWRQVAEKSATPMIEIGGSESGESNDRDQLQAAIESTVSETSQPVWIVLIGHGTFNRGVAKFNLRGPDVSAEELSEWLRSQNRPVVIVNCASASGPFINRLSGKNRVIVTATKSGTEQNYARFGKYFAQAIAAPDSDLDHDDEVSVHEAFLRASAEVREFYEAEARIATEHALIDDNGDGRGTPATMFRGVRPNAEAKDGAQLDGKIATRMTLSPIGSKLPFTEAELAQRAEIENALDQLRERKVELDPKEYQQRLEPLMIRLARLYAAAEKRANESSAEPESK
jgi:hypothetical protein